MSDINNNWTKDELRAYLLLYCANANFIQDEEEIALITAAVDANKYKAIHKEFNRDNDYQSLQKITAAIKRLDLSEEQIKGLVGEIKELFLADGHFDQAEKALFQGLKHILK